MPHSKPLPYDLAAGEPVHISRVLNAPRELVFNVFTQTEHLVKWFGPKGFTVGAAKNDPTPGGVFHYFIEDPNGNAMWGKWEYLEITPPDSFTTISCFSDKDGGLTHHPMAPDWPSWMITRTSFHATPDGKTEVRMVTQAYNATEKELAFFAEHGKSLHTGWEGTFQQLDAYLATLA